MMTLSEIMTEHPFTLGPENSVKQAMELMQQERIRHVPIVDEHQHLLGLVTLSDILATRESKLLLINPEREAEFTDSVQLDEIMTRQVASVDPHAGIRRRPCICSATNMAVCRYSRGASWLASSPSRTSSPWPSICWS